MSLALSPVFPCVALAALAVGDAVKLGVVGSTAPSVGVIRVSRAPCRIGPLELAYRVRRHAEGLLFHLLGDRLRIVGCGNERLAEFAGFPVAEEADGVGVEVDLPGSR